MKTHAFASRSYEFYFAHLDTLVQVEPSDHAVVIRATRDTFSARRKDCFVHELAAEGFIDDDYRWFSFMNSHPLRQVRWLVDISWLHPNQTIAAQTRRFVLRLLGSACALWLALVCWLFLRTAG